LGEYKGDDPRITELMRSGLKSGDFNRIFQMVELARKRKAKEVLPDLEDLKNRYPFLGETIDQAVKEIKG
jgi:hypothetical protein